MIKSELSISEVKNIISGLQSKAVRVTVNMGRNKYVKFDGELAGVYPALFTVNPSDKSFKGKTSYSYSEYMCGRVKIQKIAD